jgi:hypothetical protein
MKVSRRDFLKWGASLVEGLAVSPLLRDIDRFHEGKQVRVATGSVSVYAAPTDKSRIGSQWFRDELVHVYDEINAGEPAYNPIWYRVWGGYMHRGRLQKVETILNEPQNAIPGGRQG